MLTPDARLVSSVPGFNCDCRQPVVSPSCGCTLKPDAPASADPLEGTDRIKAYAPNVGNQPPGPFAPMVPGECIPRVEDIGPGNCHQITDTANNYCAAKNPTCEPSHLDPCRKLDNGTTAEPERCNRTMAKLAHCNCTDPAPLPCRCPISETGPAAEKALQMQSLERAAKHIPPAKTFAAASPKHPILLTRAIPTIKRPESNLKLTQNLPVIEEDRG